MKIAAEALARRFFASGKTHVEFKFRDINGRGIRVVVYEDDSFVKSGSQLNEVSFLPPSGACPTCGK